MAGSLKFNTKFQIKSISLPCRSHPSTDRIEQELNKIKTWESTTSSSRPSAETICNGLTRLAELYQCLDDLLGSSMTESLIFRHRNEKWVEDIADGCMSFLDICGITRDMVSQMKEQVRDLRCALRRRRGESTIDSTVAKYNCFRNKMKKDAKGLISSLKQEDKMIGYGGCLVIDPNNHHLAAVIRVLTQVSDMTISVLDLLLTLFSAPTLKPNRWSLVVSKLMHKKAVSCQEDRQHQGEITNELEGVDAALFNILSSPCEGAKMEIAQSRLEKMEVQIEIIENGLECMFRRLIRTRASLLNIISQ